MSYQLLSIEKFINSPIDSNCYIISQPMLNNCVVVDPSHHDVSFIGNFLEENKLKPEYIIITHEHFDHISSVEYLRKKYGSKLVASEKCSESIVHPKKNLSLFYDQVGFACNAADIIINDKNLMLKWGNIDIHFFITAGHSEGSMCFSMNNHLFTGDTIMRAYKPVIKLPGGDKEKLISSINKLLDFFAGDTIIYPGHGEVFFLSDINKPELLQ